MSVEAICFCCCLYVTARVKKRSHRNTLMCVCVLKAMLALLKLYEFIYTFSERFIAVGARYMNLYIYDDYDVR